MTTSATPVWPSLQVYQIYGANTDVGKTVVSTLLCLAARHARPEEQVAFLKPVSTGHLDEADDRHVHKYAPAISVRCLYQFDEPVSPHLAAARAGQVESGAEGDGAGAGVGAGAGTGVGAGVQVPGDEQVVKGIRDTLQAWAEQGFGQAVVETAGGVLSPGPSGTPQADLYRPLRLGVVLVADSRLGGISASISAYESLLVRGYDVRAVVLFANEYYANHDYLAAFFGRHAIPLVALPPPPSRARDSDDGADDALAMPDYYGRVARSEAVQGLVAELAQAHRLRLQRLEHLAVRAHRCIWYPFTQHHGLVPEQITAIDSAYGDQFQVVRSAASQTTPSSVLSPVFDGSASWWTQGLGHGNAGLALEAAYAAGRYGHVMFALGAHEPAVDLAELLLRYTANDRLSRVFYSDNGSTAMEVAVKMALRASAVRYGWADAGDRTESWIVGLRGSYHGDTIAAMDCSEPSAYNKTVDWYRGRGFWFDFPHVCMLDGVWSVVPPPELTRLGAVTETFASLADVFAVDARQGSATARLYADHIRRTLKDLVVAQGRRLGALIMEPVVLGAGGMILADPLFQHTLIQTIRQDADLIQPGYSTGPGAGADDWSGLPVIFDEVFTGLYRLFHFTASALFPAESRPDIMVNAKLLTGGLLPLATTMASEPIFRLFNSTPAKELALLHGHSYTAHPVGCQVATSSLRTMLAMERDGVWTRFKHGWGQKAAADDDDGADPSSSTDQAALWSIWPHSLVADLSRLGAVDGAWALGTVLSVTLRDQSGGGYTSSVAQHLQATLRQDGAADADAPAPFAIQSRVLGNVFYLIASLITSSRDVDRIAARLTRALAES